MAIRMRLIEDTFRMELIEPQLKFTLSPAKVVIRDLDAYPGPYEATPSYAVQIFNTNGYRMTDNFTVKSILDTQEILIIDGTDSIVMGPTIVEGGAS